jgi:SAM-dependent methyltransferase
MPNPDFEAGAPPDTPIALGALSDAMKTFGIGRDAEASWRDLKPTLLRLIKDFNAHRLLEIGGGRFPYLSATEVEQLGCELTVNDILEDELARAPAEFHKACFDISAPLPASLAREEYDFVFSRMVFEHVRDGRQAWSNCLQLLRPGGVAFAFVPTLWSPPFVVNRLTPERLSARVLRMIDADRTQEGTPKFPAYYQLCRGDDATIAPVLRDIGFSEVAVVPFYGTPYLPVIPVVKHIARAFDRVIDAFNIKAFTSYAYIVARK